MYEFLWFFAGVALGLMVKVSFAPTSNVQPGVSGSRQDNIEPLGEFLNGGEYFATLPKTRAKINMAGLPKPSIQRVK